MARLAATSRIAAHRSAIKLDFSISHDRNSVLILCIIVVAVFFVQGSICAYVYICMCVHVHVYAHVWVRVCTCVSIHLLCWIIDTDVTGHKHVHISSKWNTGQKYWWTWSTEDGFVVINKNKLNTIIDTLKRTISTCKEATRRLSFNQPSLHTVACSCFFLFSFWDRKGVRQTSLTKEENKRRRAREKSNYGPFAKVDDLGGASG